VPRKAHPLRRSGYLANLTADRTPTLEGVEVKLRAGARVGDVGRERGASTILMTQALSHVDVFRF
jgi:hypothetical protein